DISVFVKYGMLTDDKFFEKAEKFFLLKTTEGEYFTLAEYKEKVATLQTDKDGKVVYLYSNSKDIQDSAIAKAKNLSYSVLLFDHPIDSHLIQRIEGKEENVSIKRIDAAPLSELINKDEKIEEVLSKKEIEKIENLYKEVVGEGGVFNVSTKALSPQEAPVLIVQDEFMRRMKEMSAMSGGMGFGNFPESYNVVVNTNHDLNRKIAGADSGNELAQHAIDLAKLANGLLKGEELTKFINRSLQSMNS
ncbi:MAG: molecular chaperone HtpG, partial [Bacteroidetes bacterium]|nr:molecular chaperone HtpG [Bacteroidota bacterium]